MKKETLNKINKCYKDDNCQTKNEFIEKAINFYCGYLESDSNTDYFAKVITSTLKGIVDNSEMKICKIIYKLAVEQALTMTLVAINDYDLTNGDIHQLRHECEKAIRHTNGNFNFNDAFEWQHGDN